MNDLKFNNWIKRAQDDIKNAEVLLDKKILPWIICFHCQQAIEKYIKALQIIYLKDYTREHNLLHLVQSLRDHIQIDDHASDLVYISNFYIVTRYPTDQDAQIKITDAEEVFQLTKKIITVLDGYIKKSKIHGKS